MLGRGSGMGKSRCRGEVDHDIVMIYLSVIGWRYAHDVTLTAQIHRYPHRIAKYKTDQL